MLRSLRTSLGYLVGCVVAVLLGASAAVAQQPIPRLALIVGNSAYADIPLPTSANDAGLVARTLSQAGFAVTAAGDVDRAQLDAVFETFAAQVKMAGSEAIVFVYLAGYGLQYSGDIYLVPLGTKIARDIDVPNGAVSVLALRQQLEAMPAKARIFVYDLARETPFAQDGTRLAGGLALIQPAAGSLLAYNAAPGTVAMPDVAPYGAYARALCEMIATPGLRVQTLFDRVRLRVSMLTAGVTVPWNSGTLADDVMLSSTGPALRTTAAEPRPADVSSAEQAYVAAVALDTLDGYLAFLKTYPAEPLAARIRTLAAVRREALLWSETVRVDSDRSYWTYMRRYPRGPHLPDARRRLFALHAPLEPPPRFDIVVTTSAAPPPASDLALVDRPSVTLDDAAWPPVPATADALPPSSAFYDELLPPPLVAEGVLAIADPIAGLRAESVAITQPTVPSGVPIVAYTSFLPNDGWIVETKSGGKTTGRTTMTPGPNGDRTIVQTASDGLVIARTTLNHDTAGTTIIQTGPSGGILTKSVTRANPGGGKTTVLTTGGNQLIATIEVDRQGMTSVQRGPGALPSARRPTAPAQVAIPADPPAPPPLTMPMSSLPAPVAAPPASKDGDAKAPAGKTEDSKAPDSKGPTTSDAKTPVTTDTEVVPPDPAALLPIIAPLPPRRALAPAGSTSAEKASPSRRAKLVPRGRAPGGRRRR